MKTYLTFPRVYRSARFDGPHNLKEAACRLAFDEDPQAAFVFCSVEDYAESGMTGERAKIASFVEPDVFYLMPDAYVARGALHAITPDDGVTPPEHLYEQLRVAKQLSD